MDSILSVSGRKRLLSETDDSVLTPKKIRAQLPPTPTSKRISKSASSSTPTRLPSSLQPLLAAYEAVEDSMIPALATGGVPAPVTDPTDPRKMCIKNVLHHLSVPGLSVETLKRLVYILEWEAERTVGSSKLAPSLLDDDPFGGGPMTPTKPNRAATQWTRGGDSGIVISATTRLDHPTGRRSPAYGIGIQRVAGKGKSKDFVLRWLDEADERKEAVEDKLRAWAESQRKATRDSTRVHKGRSASPTPAQLPPVPFADLPPLTAPRTVLGLGTPSPVKRGLLFQTPTKPKASTAGSIPFPTPEQTPVSSASKPTPITPSPTKTAVDGSTPSTARRDALRERIRQKSLQNNGTPTKSRVAITVSRSDGTEETKMVSKEVMKRRCVLGRLDGIAECVASLFSRQQSGSTLGMNRRRVMRMDEVVRVVVKSSKSPISAAEAKESLDMLVDLCPTFVTCRVIDREPWLEMPTAVAAPTTMTSSPLKNALPITTASASTSPVKPLATAFSLANPPSTPPRITAPSTPRKTRPMPAVPTSPTPSPGRRFIPSSPGGALSREEIEDELLNRRAGEGSPRRIRQFVGVDGAKIMTLADVRERIQKELEKD
ncbi:hypothetical protein FRC04_003672 [Tulasnella sp. 424]|nr:hypothetical protein FRC04_003672 [Tulasnella sp. 424]KAG8977005.1 hypothetical protein FRC05_002524 [Tulasnella sp. 425]